MSDDYDRLLALATSVEQGLTRRMAMEDQIRADAADIRRLIDALKDGLAGLEVELCDECRPKVRSFLDSSPESAFPNG